MVKVIGMFTTGTVPGLNLALRKPEIAALSSDGWPVLLAMLTLVTLPLGETFTRATPLPVRRARLAS